MIEGRLARGEAGYDRDIVPALRAPPRADGRARAIRSSRRFGPARLPGIARRRNADAAARVARHAVCLRSAAGQRAVPRRGRRAPVPARSHADAAAAERAARADVRGWCSASCRDCDEPGGAPAARAVVARRARATIRVRCCSACRPGTRPAPTLTLPFGVRARVVAGATAARSIIEESAVE